MATAVAVQAEIPGGFSEDPIEALGLFLSEADLGIRRSSSSEITVDSGRDLEANSSEIPSQDGGNFWEDIGNGLSVSLDPNSKKEGTIRITLTSKASRSSFLFWRKPLVSFNPDIDFPNWQEAYIWAGQYFPEFECRVSSLKKRLQLSE